MYLTNRASQFKKKIMNWIKNRQIDFFQQKIRNLKIFKF